MNWRESVSDWWLQTTLPQPRAGLRLPFSLIYWVLDNSMAHFAAAEERGDRKHAVRTLKRAQALRARYGVTSSQWICPRCGSGNDNADHPICFTCGTHVYTEESRDCWVPGIDPHENAHLFKYGCPNCWEAKRDDWPRRRVNDPAAIETLAQDPSTARLMADVLSDLSRLGPYPMIWARTFVRGERERGSAVCLMCAEAWLLESEDLRSWTGYRWGYRTLALLQDCDWCGTTDCRFACTSGGPFVTQCHHCGKSHAE